MRTGWWRYVEAEEECDLRSVRARDGCGCLMMKKHRRGGGGCCLREAERRGCAPF